MSGFTINIFQGTIIFMVGLTYRVWLYEKHRHKTNVQVAHEALASSIEENSTRPLAKLFAEALTDGVCEWLCYTPEM